MDLETRVQNLEDMVASIANTINNNQFYTEADIQGVRNNLNEITHYTVSKQGYIDDTEVVFENVPSGNITVFFDSIAREVPAYNIERVGSDVRVTFEPLEEITPITISVQ